MDEHPLLGLIVILLLVVLNALVSAAEAALTNVNEGNLRRAAEDGDKKSARLVRHIDMPHRYINVLEIMLTAISIIIGMLYSFSLYGYLKIWLLGRFLTDKPRIASSLIMAVVAILIMYLVVLFGVLLPKRLAARRAESFAYALCGLISVSSFVFKPISWLLEKNTNLLLRMLRINPYEAEDNVTEEEIISMVNEGQEQGVLEADEAEMISNIIEFNEKQVKEIMTHRKKIVALDTTMDIESAMEFMIGESFSRFPLYEEDIDNVVGVVHMKDVMKYYMDDDNHRRSIAEIARQPYFVPDTQNIDTLFHDMQLQKVHMAIVVDEYGQTAGLVAMEDILEEIVGDIQDEYDDEEEAIVRDGDSYIIHGAVDLDELCEETGLEIEEDDEGNFDTLNGLLISLLDRIPNDGETEIISYAGYRFEILEVRDKMINLVRMTKEEEPEEEKVAGEEDE